MPDIIISSFYNKMADQNFEAYGILDSNNKIHTLGTDSKIIGRIFEMFSQPVLEEIATENGYILKTPESQTVYPDFIMMTSENSNEKLLLILRQHIFHLIVRASSSPLAPLGHICETIQRILNINIQIILSTM